MIKIIIRWLEEHKGFSFIILLGIIAVMGYCSSIPGISVSPGFSWLPTAYHFLIFFAFSLFLLIIIADREVKKKDVLITIIISLIIAILDEIHQSSVPFRDPSIRDVLIDFSGVLFSMMIGYLLGKKLSH